MCFVFNYDMWNIISFLVLTSNFTRELQVNILLWKKFYWIMYSSNTNTISGPHWRKHKAEEEKTRNPDIALNNPPLEKNSKAEPRIEPGTVLQVDEISTEAHGKTIWETYMANLTLFLKFYIM